MSVGKVKHACERSVPTPNTHAIPNTEYLVLIMFSVLAAEFHDDGRADTARVAGFHLAASAALCPETGRPTKLLLLGALKLARTPCRA